MGACCIRSIDSETFIKEMLSSFCLQKLTIADINSILFSRIRGGNDIIGRTNLEITEESYSDIVNDITDRKYLKNKKNVSKGPDHHFEILKEFLKNLFVLFNINNSVNCLIYKLIMCPILLKPEDEFEGKAKFLYNSIKYVDFSNKDHDCTISEIPYPQFCNTFSTYLAMILSGFTKILLECLDENNSDEIMRDEIKQNLKTLFDAETVKDYYSFLTVSLIKQIVNVENSSLENCTVNEASFISLCKEHPEILNYIALREEYIKFAKKKLSTIIIK